MRRAARIYYGRHYIPTEQVFMHSFLERDVGCIRQPALELPYKTRLTFILLYVVHASGTLLHDNYNSQTFDYKKVGVVDTGEF